MNYTGDRRSILTLAHELGHGLHGVLAQPLGLFNSSTPLTTAETASVFGEALTFERLLADEDDPRRRLDLLTGRIEDAIATTFRQIAMNRFEHAAHTERREQGELALERIGELWLEAQRNALRRLRGRRGVHGPWWSYIPHFTGSPGYVYAYAYGYLFSLAIYRRYVTEGDAMVEPYLDLLRTGGSRSPEESRSSWGSISPIRRSGRAGSTHSPRSSTRPSASPPRSARPRLTARPRRPSERLAINR